MKIRSFSVQDAEFVARIMEQEDIMPDDVYLKNGLSFILEEDGVPVGFFSFKNQGGKPRLAHFCVDQKRRSFKNGLELARAVKSKCHEIALTAFYVDVRHGYLEKFIQWFFRPKSRYVNGDYSYFFVEVK